MTPLREASRQTLPLVLALGLSIASAPIGEPITIYLAGDSTMATKQPEKRPETGWGEFLQAFFDETAARVENHARNGRSTRTFIEEGRWQAIVDRLRPGDYVFVQFGHNDQSRDKTDRYTPPPQFRGNLIRFVRETRSKGATPILLTPVVRRRFDGDGQFYDVHGEYPELTRRVAEELGVTLIDTHRKSADLLRHYGEEGSRALFMLLEPGEHPHYPNGLDDNTHFSPLGAQIIAGLAVEELHELDPRLAGHLTKSIAKYAPSLASIDAIVDARFGGKSGALVNGTPTFASVGEALSSIPSSGPDGFTIFIRSGRYDEKLSVDRPGVRLIGESRHETIITYDDSADSPGPGGVAAGTAGSYTLRITAPDFHAENLTIQNSFDYPGNAAKSDDDPTKVRNPQAVAVMTTTGNDRAVFHNCIIDGFQDTLFIDAGRHYFERCRIVGHVDFIFGSGQAVFDDCDIVSKDRVGKNPTGYVTAPSTPISYPYGFLFVDSRLVKESDDLPAGSVRLGRPWHPGADPRSIGSAVFIQCYMDDHIGRDGYAPISGRNEEGEQVWFDLEPTSRFFEHRSYGPGAHLAPRRPRLPAAAAAWYSTDRVLNGWHPQTGR